MEILINGCVDTTDNPITVDEFNDKFIQWIESNGWYFGGGVNEYKTNILGAVKVKGKSARKVLENLKKPMIDKDMLDKCEVLASKLFKEENI